MSEISLGHLKFLERNLWSHDMTQGRFTFSQVQPKRNTRKNGKYVEFNNFSKGNEHSVNCIIDVWDY